MHSVYSKRITCSGRGSGTILVKRGYTAVRKYVSRERDNGQSKVYDTTGNVLCHEIIFSEMIEVWRSVVRSGIRYGREESGLKGIMGHHKGRKKSDVDFAMEVMMAEKMICMRNCSILTSPLLPHTPTHTMCNPIEPCLNIMYDVYNGSNKLMQHY